MKARVKNIKLNELVDLIYENALNDREKAIELFDELQNGIAGQITNHAAVGVVIAKYLERLNKANDQLLNLAEMIQHAELETKRQISKNLSDEDKEKIYSMINESLDDDK